MFVLSARPKDFLCLRNLVFGSILTLLGGFLSGSVYLMLYDSPQVLEAKADPAGLSKNIPQRDYSRVELSLMINSAMPQVLLIQSKDSAFILDLRPALVSISQNGTAYVTGISRYRDGEDPMSSYSVPLAAFSGLELNKPFGKVELWFKSGVEVNGVHYEAFLTAGAGQLVGLNDEVVADATSETTVQPEEKPVPVTTVAQPVTSLDLVESASKRRWRIQSVSSMKESKDRLCNQRDSGFIAMYVNRAKELGANYLAVETPYDDPTCGSALNYTYRWVEQVRQAGLSVWHRHMPLTFEGIYDTPKKNGLDYLGQIENYIRQNPGLFKAGDIFTPIPEPQNGGIKGITYCSQNVCQFGSAGDFNRFLREAILRSREAFAAIGLAGKIEIGYYGFDGFIAWGDNNPDWNGILEDETVKLMGNITIDHYPQVTGGNMAEDLAELNARYPGVPVVIGEWGSIVSGDYAGQVEKAMAAAAANKSVIGFNYWHLGAGGHEALINEDFSQKSHFKTVQSFFLP
jgi:hypothetical protein